MTVTAPIAPTAPTASPRLARLRGQGRARTTLALGAGLLVLLSFVRAVTGESDVTSSGTIGAALVLAVPIGMAGLGGLWSERAGVVNIGLEGMLILGTWTAAWVGYQHGPWAGVLAGIVGGMLGGLLHAVATVTFGVDHVVSGVAINILAAGLARYLSVIFFDGVEGGGPSQSPPITSHLPTISLPGATTVLAPLERHGWFLVSDLAGVARGLTTNVSLLTVLCIAIAPLSFVVLWRTPFGLRLRMCGERPVAAESLGVDVYRTKYAAVIISGGMAGLGGAFLVTVASTFYREGQTAGRGYIGLAALIFGNWRPGGLMAGAALFGYADGLQLRQEGAIHGLLLFVALLLAIVAIRNALGRHAVSAGLALAFAGAILVWYLLSDTVPNQLVFFTPHLTTLLVLSLSAQRLRPPAADGARYRRGQGE